MSDAFVDTMWATATKAAASGQSFAQASDLSALEGMSPSQLDNLPFGVVKLDDVGTVGFYNRYESELADVAPSHAMGKNFFTDIAPCTNNKVFRGCFSKGVELKKADCLFSYTFTYKMRPTEVKVHLHRGRTTNWLLVQKR